MFHLINSLYEPFFYEVEFCQDEGKWSYKFRFNTAKGLLKQIFISCLLESEYDYPAAQYAY